MKPTADVPEAMAIARRLTLRWSGAALGRAVEEMTEADARGDIARADIYAAAASILRYRPDSGLEYGARIAIGAASRGP